MRARGRGRARAGKKTSTGAGGAGGGQNTRTVVLALAANLGAALAKLAGALFTGSGAMFAEAIHTFADSGNEILLLIAQKHSAAPSDEQHPLGHGRAAYFWALIASLGVFTIGALLSIRQGILNLVHPENTVSFRVAYVILAVSFCLEGVSLVQAVRQLRGEAQSLQRTLLEHLDVSSDPIARAVFAEDAAALIGNGIALVGIALHQATGSAIPEGIAAIVIGLLLGYVALHLAARNGDILIGGQAPTALRDRIERIITAHPGVLTVAELLVTFIGPRRVWVVARVGIDKALDGITVEELVRAVETSLQRESPFIARVDVVPRGRHP